jgi:hypothetical protein|tara:strand:- start:498 stop:785 length:288 start_codon:yes stop_codon:yes gene_type:complete
MTHKEKDLLVGNLVDKNVALKARVDYLEGENYEGHIEALSDMIEDNEVMLADNKAWLIDAEATNTMLLYDIRELYKRLDSKNEDIQILNSLITKG